MGRRGPAPRARAQRDARLAGAAGAAAESLERRVMLTATMLSNFTYTTPGSSPAGFTAVGGTDYFTTTHIDSSGGAPAATGLDLWRTDGTAAGTAFVAHPWTSSPTAAPMVSANNLLYYVAPGYASAPTLYEVDPATNTPAAMTAFTYTGSTIAGVTAVGGSVFFAANEGNGYSELWVSGGTAASTVQLTPPSHFVTGSVGNLVNFNGTLYFTANDGTHGLGLWKSDGTAAGTVMVSSVPGSPSGFTASGGTLYFAANDGTHGTELWKTDGTAAGPALLADVNPGTAGSSPANLTAVGNTLFFSANDGAHGAELWKSDGTTAGTSMVLDAAAGTTGSSPSKLTNLNGKLIYAATNSSGTELWASDGTAAGTAPLADLNPGAGSSSPANLTAVSGGAAGNVVFFTATDGTHGTALYKTDGTPAGTGQVAAINNGNGQITALAAFNGKLLFSANDGVHGAEPWISDGTAAGTAMVKDVAYLLQYTTPGALYPVGQKVFLNAANASGLWFSDGTPAGTHSLPSPAVASGGWVLNSDGGTPTALAVGNTLYYSGNGNLWRSDGTAAGTQLIQTMTGFTNPFTQGYISDLTAFNGRLYFSGTSTAAGDELWTSDGTSAGTYLLDDLAPGTVGGGQPASSSPRDMVNVNGTLYFDSGHTRLYKSDGTAAGTVKVDPNTFYGSLFGLRNLDGTLYFAGTVGTSPGNPTLWKSDGTAAGTVAVTAPNFLALTANSPLVVFDNALYFDGYDNAGSGTSNGPGLWKVDGATGALTLVQSGVTARNFTVSGDRLFFVNGLDLWSLDGGTGAAALVHTYTGNNGPANLTDLDGTLYFTAPGGLWESDGTPAGTQVVPGAAGTATSVANAGGNLYYVNNDGIRGPQLYVVPGAAVAPAAPSALAASAPSGGEIDLTWADNAGNESGFHLQRSTSPTFATIDASFDLPPNTAQYADTTVQPGQTYYYRLTAYNASGDSSAVTASTATPAAPAAPTNLAATTPSGTEVDLTFADNSTNETGFVVQRSAHPTFDPIDQTFTLPAGTGAAGSTVSVQDTSVAPITTYYYRAFATNAAGRSGYSNTLAVTTPNAPPAAPTGLTAVPFPSQFSAGQVLLNWNESAANATGYVVERRTLPGGAYASITTQSPLAAGYATYVDSTAAVGGRYAYRVYAVNAAGTKSAYSNEVAVTDAPLASMVADINPAAASSPSSLTTFDGAVYFAADDTVHGRELWRSDGTPAGTVMVKDIDPGGAGSVPTNLTVVPGASGTGAGDTLFFAASDGADGHELWKTDGTADGTVMVKDITAGSGSTSMTAFAAAGGELYFVVNTNPSGSAAYQLWQSDGTAAGTFPTPGAPQVTYSTAVLGPWLVASGDSVYFDGINGAAGTELWRAGPSGASMVGDLYPGAGGSNPYDLSALNGTLYFFASPAANSYALYRIDPASGAAQAVTTFNGGDQPYQLTGSDGSLYFVGSDPLGHALLYKSDGTPQGTAVVPDLGHTFTGNGFTGLFAFGGALYFQALEGAYGNGLYRTDGTAAGTVRLSSAAVGNSTYTPVTTAAGTELFVNGGTNLYETDGTVAGTRFVQHTDVQDLGSTDYPDRAVLNGTLFFTADPTGNNRELWQAAVAPAALPAAPSAVTATLPSPAAVVVTWAESSANVSGFWIDRSRTADFSAIDTTFYAAPGTTSFVDQGYPPGATVYYRVRAYNAAGESANVAAAAVATPPAAVLLATDTSTQGNWKGTYGSLSADPFQGGFTPPGTELTLSATGQTATTIVKAADNVTDPRALQDSGDGLRALSAWTSPTSFTVDVNDNAAVTRQLAMYMVDWENAGRSQRVDEIDPATGNTIASQTVSNFSAGQWLVFNLTGHVQFRFTSLAGPGAVLNGVFLSPSAPVTPPAAFNGLSANCPPGIVQLIWADKAGNEQGYTIERSSDGVHFTQIGSVGPGNGTSQNYIDSTAQQDVWYYYRVRAYNAAGVSPYTPAILAQAGWVRPDQLAVFTGTDTTTGGSWMGNYSKGGAFWAIAGDSETMSLTGSTEITWAASTSDPRALQKTNPTNGDRVAAAWSSPTSFTMSPPWSVNSGHYSIYAVDWDNAGRVERFDIVDATTNKVLDSRTISNFQNGTYVSWNLRGHIKIVVTCLSGPNAVVSGYFADSLYAPAAPSNLTAAPGPGRVDLAWSDNSNNEEGFRIERSYDGIYFSQVGVAAANATTWSDTTGTPGLIYYYRVRAYNSWGASDPSGTASATDPDSAPSNLVRAASLVVAPNAALAVDDGSGQRSVVRSLTVTFNTPVTLADGALTLAQRSGLAGAAGGAVPITVSNPSGDGRTYLITFAGTSGPALESGSLADGVYDLTAHAALVSNAYGPPMAADVTLTFHRLFGDSDGNGTVNALDYARFKQAFGSSSGAAGYNAAFDVDASGTINALDYARFKSRFGTTLTY